MTSTLWAKRRDADTWHAVDDDSTVARTAACGDAVCGPKDAISLIRQYEPPDGACALCVAVITRQPNELRAVAW